MWDLTKSCSKFSCQRNEHGTSLVCLFVNTAQLVVSMKQWSVFNIATVDSYFRFAHLQGQALESQDLQI